MEKILESFPMNESVSGMRSTVTKLIRKRRSSYPDNYTGGTIPEEDLWEILTNATWAPTHKMTEPWRFVVFKDQCLKAFGEYMAEFYKDYYRSVLTESDFLSKYRYLSEYPLQAACLVGIVLVRHPKIELPEWEEIAAVGGAVQNMALTCEAMGLGAYWSSTEAAIRYVAQTGLQENERSLGIFYIGNKGRQVTKSNKRRTPAQVKTTIMYY